MSITSHLYLLVFPQHSLFKIGKADDLHQRIDTLRMHWGEPDLAASYSVEVPAESVVKLERGLQAILLGHHQPQSAGEGKTEFFRLDGLQRALQVIDLFSVDKTLRKGIPHREIAERSQAALRPSGYRRMHAQLRAQTDSLKDTADRFHRINRLLLLLERRQSRIAFEQEVGDDQIVMRIAVGDEEEAARLAEKMHGLLHVRMSDVEGNLLGVNICTTAACEGDVLRLHINRPSDYRGTPLGELLAGLSADAEYRLSTLPAQSAAARCARNGTGGEFHHQPACRPAG